MIKLEIIGRVGADAESKFVNNQWVTNFSIAHSESYKDQHGEKKQKTIWVRCEIWSKNDNIAQYIKKGIQLYVTGQPKVSAYQNSERQIIVRQELRVKEFEFLSASKTTEASGDQAQDGASNYTQSPAPFEAGENVHTSDDLPF